MESPNKLLYPMLLVAAFSVTAFSMVGIATMTGKIPSVHSQVVDSAAPATQRVAANEPANERAESPATRTEGPTTRSATPPAKVAPTPCAACGVVESIRIVERRGAGTGLGAVAGGLTGAVVGNQIGGGHGRTAMAILGGVGGAYAGNEIEKNVKKTSAWQIKVRLDDGTLRVSTVSQPPEFAVGDKVRVDNGVISRRG